MGNVQLLDCTLRDGGYINDWNFGVETIKGVCKKLAQTGVDICEVGFIKGDVYDENKTLFPDTNAFKKVIFPKSPSMMYVGMLDMSAPIPKDKIYLRSNDSIDGIRVIFKKDKINEAYEYCEYIKKQGYVLFVNFVGTDLYSDSEFIEGVNKFNQLNPYAVSIVDSFGLIKRKHFLRLVYIADNNLSENIKLAYHAHNNLQQAFGNAESLVEMNLKRDIIVDACVFGMGRGAGNLNLELFAEFMNENYDTNYNIEPMLEIMDQYLYDIYHTKFWGYSIPLYLSASLGCHPNYAIYLAEKDSLTVKSFGELLKSIPSADKATFTKEKAEKYYIQYLQTYYDDKSDIDALAENLKGKSILLIAPGNSICNYSQQIMNKIDGNTVVFAVNFDGGKYTPQYIFSSNMRRYSKIDGRVNTDCIITSNMTEAVSFKYKVNFSSFSISSPDIVDNSGLMLLYLLKACGINKVLIAGMDGYSGMQQGDYVNSQLDYDFSNEAYNRNQLIAKELLKINKSMSLEFVTPSYYDDIINRSRENTNG